MLRSRWQEHHQHPRRPQLRSRVIDARGNAGTLVTITPPCVLFDYQRPSSKPKPVTVADLRFLPGQ